MRTKRHGKREIVDSVPENRDNKAHHTASTSSSSSSLVDDNNYVKVDDASAVLVGDSIAASANARSSSSSSSIPSDHATIRPTHNGNNDSNKQKQFQKKHRAATTRLLSAYESIVFSESQIPVFLTQDHRQQRKQRAQSLRAQLKGHVRIRKGAEGTLQESDDAVVEGNNNNNNNAQRHQNPIRADTTDAEASSFSSPVDDDDVTVAQADDAHLYASSSSSASNVLDSGLEHSVAQGAVSNNNNLRSYHVDDQGDVVGVTITDDDKNSPSLGPLSHASAATVVVVQVEQEEEKVENGELSAEPTRLEAAVFEVSEEAIEGSPAAEEAVVQKEKEAAVEDESENEDEWVTIADADLVSNIVDGIVSSINSSPSSNVEFQSSESDDAPFIPFTSSQEQQRHHPTAAAAGTRLFHNGCLSSPTIASLGLLLTAIGLAYRFYIRKQQQQQKRHPVLPSDIKTAPLLPSTSSSSSKSVHRLSVDSLPSPTTREGARTTAMRDYVGFNVQ
ncbi:hypothetical protein BGW39_001944 [Mortierella sp. 14UC]|nr:hypothetical protein BGW39_001944 [Mortierella sp. 14UC]